MNVQKSSSMNVQVIANMVQGKDSCYDDLSHISLLIQNKKKKQSIETLTKYTGYGIPPVTKSTRSTSLKRCYEDTP